MTDVATPAAPPVAAPPPPPVAPAPVVVAAAPVATPPALAAAAPAPPAAAEPEEGKEPAWLAARLARARLGVLKEIGVEDPKDAKTAIEAHRAAIEASKSELQKAQERAATVDPLSKQLADYRAVVEHHAAVELGKLTPEQRTAVTTIAGADPAAQLRAVGTLRPTWGAPAPVVAPAAPPPAPAPPPLAAPANTAPTAGAPPAGAPPAVVDHIEVLKSLEATNPVRAARYRTTYAGEIAAATKARGSK